MRQQQTIRLTTASKPQPTLSAKTQENQQELLPTTPTTQMVSPSHQTNMSTGRNNQSQQSLLVQTKQLPVQPVNQQQQVKQTVQVVLVQTLSRQTTLLLQQQNN